MDKDSAILQGAFLLADRLCLPSSLSCLLKADWSKVGDPILAAMTEICGPEAPGDPSDGRAASWKRKLLCAVWLKLLCRETGEVVETAWRENPFFPLQNGLPDVNSVVLLELVKSMSASKTFARLLLRLPPTQICSELERLVRHVRSNPASEGDVRLFLEVWWELWKGLEERAPGDAETVETMFGNQFTRLAAEATGVSPRAAKRFKPDTMASSVNNDILYVLLHALRDMRDQVSTTDLCLKALTISLDVLYTSFLIERAVMLPIKEKMHILSNSVCVRETNSEDLSPELVLDAQRDLRASLTPSRFRPSQMEPAEALAIVTELARFWQNGGLLTVSAGSKQSYSAFRLQQSVRRVLESLRVAGATEAGAQEAERNDLRGFLETLSFPAVESNAEVDLRVTTTVIRHRLEDFGEYAALFASERSWADRDELWLDCLEKNQAAFRQPDTLLGLCSTLTSKLHGGGSSETQCRKLMTVVADVFSNLSLEDKNKTLAAVLATSSRGFFGHPVASAVTDGFEQELNMAFNCIIQGSGGGNLSTAASLVARVAFQNPEATLRSCCHSAVFNKGAFTLMAEILRQLPGLRGQREPRGANEGTDQRKGPESGSGLLCRCLQDVIRTRSLSANDKEQFLKFLGLLMMPVMTDEGGAKSFVSPQEVVITFILPNISSGAGDIELSLQLLHAALCVDVHEDTSPPPTHWVMGCSPFPLLHVLAQLHHQALRCWGQTPEDVVPCWSMDTKELLASTLASLGRVVGAEVAAEPDSWSRAVFWLYNKVEELDWMVRFHLKPVWGDHFKNEVPSSLLMVCDLPEQDWTGLDLPQYGQGTGLLAWMECCSVSEPLCSTMLSSLSLDRQRPDHVGLFSKGLMVALTQALPCCSVSQWRRLLGALRELLASGRLHVPFSLEYVDFLPLLDLRRFSGELRLSVLLLRVLQLLSGSSCSGWMVADGWAHVARLYAVAVRELTNSLRDRLPPPEGAGDAKDGKHLESKETRLQEEAFPSQEILFVLSQLYCHVQHVQVMMPGGQSEPLFLCSLEILSHYEAVMAAYPGSSSPLESEDARHFFSTITDNLENREMRAVLQQKIAQLVSA